MSFCNKEKPGIFKKTGFISISRKILQTSLPLTRRGNEGEVYSLGLTKTVSAKLLLSKLPQPNDLDKSFQAVFSFWLLGFAK